MRTWAFVVLMMTGCAADGDAALDEPQDATDDGKADAGDTVSCARVACGDPDAPNVLFPGNLACGGPCERMLAGEALYIPPRNGAPWGETFRLGTAAPQTLAGYSSGRIALLRRLALVGDGEHAVLVDPSWPDGARDFAGRGPEHGEAIVRAWLRADPWRMFTLVYSTRSVGWDGYAALVDDPEVGWQVQTCAVAAPHLRVPQTPQLAELLAFPWALPDGMCE
jgi:hypothetical protein